MAAASMHLMMVRFTQSASIISPLLLGLAMIGCGSEPQPAATTADTPPEVHRPPDGPEVEPPDSAPDPLASAEEPLERVDRLIESGKIGPATDLLRQLLIADPRDVHVLFRLANLKASQGELDEAISLLETIPEDDPIAGLPALGQAADWYFELERYDAAEQKYSRVLDLAPDAVLAHRQLAYLLNRQGRRHEAAAHVRALCALGDVRQDELHSLVMLNDAMYDDPDSPPADPSRPYWPIGASGNARRLFNEQRYDEAVEVLQADVASGEAVPAAVALYGRVAVEAQNDEQFQWWLSQADESVRAFSDYWAGLGTHLLAERRFEEAARALGEAVDRDPTDLITMGRLRQALLAVGEDALAEQWRTRWRATREILRVNNRISASEVPNPDHIGDLASRLDALGFKLPAVLWWSIEAALRGLPPEVHRKLDAQRRSLVEAEQAFPNQSQRLCGMDLGRYRLPKMDPAQIAKRKSDGDAQNRAPEPVEAQFVNVAADVGLEHAFSVATVPQASGFAIYQFFGGAVVVLDYDLDGLPDLYFGQGAADPPSFRGTKPNVLHRNLRARLADVTESSGTGDTRYSTGITSGDWNQDGFPDLVVSNVGEDVMFINNGDGTFTDQAVVSDGRPTRVPASVAMADVTGDALPDLFQLAYVDDPELTRKPVRNADGQVTSALVPTEFSPGADRLIGNDGTGGQRVLPWDSSERNTATSLGVVVANFDANPGNEIFIGNDLRPNQLWKRDPSSGEWSEMGLPLGCAFGYTGGATASMGIAAGDFDGTGTLDLHITNYQDDAASLFLAADGFYRDRNLQYQLNADSRAVLGFGTQAIDFDNDGLLDLVVTNGHVEDEAGSSHPFEQPPQLFRNMNGYFQLADVSDPSGYWSSRHLGRALARLDFNRDGRMDVAVSHLEATSALLINETAADNHWLQLHLVGVASERDAIGASVKVKAGDLEQWDWVTAGDGYFCRNEAVLAFGLDDAHHIDEISIAWPSGTTQTLRDLRADRRLLIVEDQPDPFEL